MRRPEGLAVRVSTRDGTEGAGPSAPRAALPHAVHTGQTQPMRGQPPLNAQRVTRLVQARELLTSGMNVDEINRQLHVDKEVLRDVFDTRGRLRLSARVAALLNWQDQDMVRALHDLPRALTNADAATLAEVLRRHAAGALDDVRQAGIAAGMQAAAIEYLFDPAGWLNADRVNSLPADQQQTLRSAIALGASAAPDAPRPLSALPSRKGRLEDIVERAARLADAQAMLAAGAGLKPVGRHIGLDSSWLGKIFDTGGRLVLSAAGQRLLDAPDAALAGRFAALPRALGPADLRLLRQVLRQHAETPLPNLREAAEDAGVARQALDHLFDEQGHLLDERVATLPARQRQQLSQPTLALPPPVAPAIAAQPRPAAPAGAARPIEPTAQMARRLMQCHALIAGGMSATQAAREQHVEPKILADVFDGTGRLRLSARAEAMLNSNEHAERLRELPRALTAMDLRLLADLFRRAGAGDLEDLRQSCVDAGVQAAAIAYLFDRDGWIDGDRIDSLPADQSQALRKAAVLGDSSGPGAPPPLWTLRGRLRDPAVSLQHARLLAEAQQALAAGSTRTQVAKQLRADQSALTWAFDRRGRLLLSSGGQRLLNTPDPALAAHFAALPRALASRDLQLLRPLLLQHAETPLPDLRAAAQAAGVSPQALDHLFDSEGRLLGERIAVLPVKQQQQLLPPQAPAAAGPSIARPSQAARRAQPAALKLTQDRARQFVQAQAQLASGQLLKTVCSQQHVSKDVLGALFDTAGRLRLSARADELLSWPDPSLVAGLRTLPRALTTADARTLADLLRRQAAGELGDLRQACTEAGMQAPAIEYLFDAGGQLGAGRVEGLPPEQQQMVRAATTLVGAAAPEVSTARWMPPGGRGGPQAEVQRAAVLAQAQRALAGDQSMRQVAEQLRVHRSWLGKVFDANGQLLLTDAAQRLMNVPEAGLAGHFASLPRALLRRDARLLGPLLQQHAATPLADLREAAVAAGVDAQAVAYLFDSEGRLLEDRAEALMLHHRQQPGPSRAAEPERTPAQPPVASFIDAQARLARGQRAREVAQALGMSKKTLDKVIDARGRLLVTRDAGGLLASAGEEDARRLAAMPRALRPSDLHALEQLLAHHRGADVDLREAGAAAGVTETVLDLLLADDGQLRADRVAGLPAEQQAALHRAMGAEAPSSPAAAPHPVAAAPGVPQPPAVQPAREPQASEVLQFFRRHPRPARALVDAQAEFRMSHQALLHLLARTGVTHVEAHGGRLPDAAVLWQRMRDAVRGDRPPADRPAATAGSASGSGTRRRAEAEPDTPPPARRVRRDAPAPVEMLARWGGQGPRSARGPARDAGLPDPGSPTLDILDFLDAGGLDPMNAQRPGSRPRR